MRLLSKSSVFTLSAMLLVLFAVITVTLAQTAARDEPEQLLKSDSFESSPEIVSAPVTTWYSELEYQYAVQISNVDGFPVEFALDVAPGGMTIDPQTGLIEWPTPQIGLHDVTVVVWDARAHFDEQAYTLEIIEGFGEPQIVSAAPLSVELNAVYDYQPEVLNPQGLPLHYDLLMAPPGMTIDAQSGRIRWLAETEGVSDVVWSVSDTADNTDTQAFELTVLPRTGEFEVGGQAVGLELSEIVLHETVTDQRLRLDTSGPFAFPIGDGSNYTIEIAEQSSINAICYVAESSGQISGGDVSSVVVQCVPGSADPEALIDEAETLADSGVTITTEQFEQTDYAQNQLSEADSARIDRNHALVLSAVDPDPDWISTGLDSDRIIVTNAGREHIINAVKLDIDFNEIGPVDSNRLKFNIRIQREDHEFEWLPREFATDIVQWTGMPGQFVVRVPDDLTRGRLVIGLRPDFDDIGQTAIAERWSEALQFEIWPVRPGVVQLNASDVLFPVDFQQPLDPASSFSLEDIQTVTQGWMDLDEMVLPLVIQSATPLAVDDLVEYKIGDEPYSGRVASVEQRGGQQFVLLYPDWLDVYDIADADDDFLVDQGVLPELITFRVGDRVPDFDAQYREFVTTLDPHDDQNPRIVSPQSTPADGRSSGSRGFFERNCSGGGQNAALVFSPKISLVPFEAKVNVSVATGGSLLTVNCSWNAFPERKIYIPIRAAGPVAIVAEKLLGTNVAIRPIGGVQFSTDGEVSAIEAFKMSLSSKDGIKANVPTDLINLIDFHSLDGNPISGSTRIGGNLGVAAEANVIDDRGLFAKLIKLFTRDFELEAGLEASATIGAGLSLSGANAPAVYSGLGSTQAGLSFNFCSRLGLSRALRNLFVRLIRFDPSVELCFRDSIPLSDPASQFSAEDILDDLQGNARVQSLTALPALSSFFGFNATGRLAPDDVLSSVFNDVHNEINYELTECENNPSGDIQTPVIACAGILCGRTEPIKLCGTQLWVNPVAAQALTGEIAESEVSFGVRSTDDLLEPMYIDFSSSPLTTELSNHILTPSRTQKEIGLSARCGPDSSAERGEVRVRTIGSLEPLEASNTNLLICRCKPTDTDCDRAWGSPHLLTADGLALDYYASGDYILSQLPNIQGMQVQARFLPGMGVSWPQAVALQVGSDVVEIHSEQWTPEPPRPQLTSHRLRVWINGTETIPAGKWSSLRNWPVLDLPGGGLLYIDAFMSRFSGFVVDPIKITVLWPEDDIYSNYGVVIKGQGTNFEDSQSFIWDQVPPIIEISLVRPDSLSGQETGMLGNNDGDPLNDMQLRNGTQIEFSDNLSWTELYAQFGADWLVRPNECLFADGCLDPEFPLSPEPIDPDRRQFAEAACFELQGWYREACIHDVALSGSIELVEGLYENSDELNSMVNKLILPGVDIPLFQLQQGPVEKFRFKELHHFSVELIEGQGEYALSLIPPRGTSAVLSSTGQGSLIDSQPRVDSVELTCIPNADWQELDSAWPEQGSLQLWTVDPLSGSPRTLLGEMILPAERLEDNCSELLFEVESVFLKDAILYLHNDSEDTLVFRIQPTKGVQLAQEALIENTICPECDISINLGYQCSGGLQKLGDIFIYGSDGILQESKPVMCQTVASTISPFFTANSGRQAENDTDPMFLDDDGRLWDLSWTDTPNIRPNKPLNYNEVPGPIQFEIFDDIDIKQISHSDWVSDHTLALDTQGQIWAWGSNRDGQLGIRSCERDDVNFISGAPCTRSSEEPILIPPDTFNLPIAQIATGDGQSFALDTEGNVWAWGNGWRGGLGSSLPDRKRIRSNPEQIQFSDSFGLPIDLKIAAIATGTASVIALDYDGKLWVWGSISPDLLGLPTALDMSPFEESKIVMINKKGNHIIALDELGRLWGWGSNNYGQVSSELSQDWINSPHLLDMNEISGIQFEWAIAGQRVTLAKSLDGDLWSWGDNEYGQLGRGSLDSSENPAKVDFYDMGDESIRFADVSGLYGNIAYDTAGRFWAWGRHEMMPQSYKFEPTPILLTNHQETNLSAEIEPFSNEAQLLSGSHKKEAVAVVKIKHSALETEPYQTVRLSDSRLSFADTSTDTIEIHRLRTLRTAIMANGADFCEEPGYYQLEIKILSENDDQILAHDSIMLECQYPLQFSINKSLDDTSVLMKNTGSENLQVTIHGLDGLSHEVQNTYSHSVCAGCELEVNINETCPIIGRLVLARAEIQNTDHQFSEFREIDCGRLNSRVATIGNSSFIVDNHGRTWGWGARDTLGLGDELDSLPFYITSPILVDRSLQTQSGFGRMSPRIESDGSFKGHGLLLDQNERLWAWGLAARSGELGNGFHRLRAESPPLDKSPAPVAGALYNSKIADYSAAYRVSIALDKRGRLWGWGDGEGLLLGNTIQSDQVFPAPSVLPFPVRTISTFKQTSFRPTGLALSQDGLELWSWGGASGYALPAKFPSITDATSENCIIPSLTILRLCTPRSIDLNALGGVPIRDISSNNGLVILLDALGRVWYWGDLGPNYPSNFFSHPNQIDLTELGNARVLGIASYASDGLYNSMFLYDEQGRIWALGYNKQGILGVGSFLTAIPNPTEINFPHTAGRIKEMTLGDSYALAIDENQCFWGWGLGDDRNGSPFIDSYNQRENSPVNVLSDYSPICFTPELRIENPISPSVGSSILATISLSTPYSFEQDVELTLEVLDEQIATLSTQTLTIPASETETSTQVSIQGVTPGSTKLIVSAANVSDINTIEKTLSVPNPNNQGFTSISAGDSHSCAIRNDGFVSCWGSNFNDQASPPNQIFTNISSGPDHNCGVGLDNFVNCWGEASDYQAMPQFQLFTQTTVGGDYSCGILQDQSLACWGSGYSPVQDLPEEPFIYIDAGRNHTCGLNNEHKALCWDKNNQLMDVPQGAFLTLSVGNGFSCGVRLNTHEVVCWGSSFHGANRPPAVPMTTVSSGNRHTCGIDMNGSAVCWGSGVSGSSDPSSVDATDLVDIAAGSGHTCATKTSGDVVCWGNIDLP